MDSDWCAVCVYSRFCGEVLHGGHFVCLRDYLILDS